MKCTYCGTENNETYRFCQKCGAQLPVAGSSDASEKKPKAVPNKKVIRNIICILLIVAFVIAAVFILASVLTGNIYSYEKATLFAVYNEDDEMTKFIYNDKIVGTYDGKIYGEQFDLSSSSFVAITDQGDLIRVTEKGISTIAIGVQYFEYALSGNYIVYLDENSTLISHDISKNDISRIANDVNVASLSLILSPNGKSFAYSINEEFENDDGNVEEIPVTYIYKDGKTKKLGKNMVVIGLTDDSKCIYYYDQERDALYTTTFKSDDKIKLAIDLEGDFLFNADHSQLIFSSGNKWYISENGNDKIKLFGDVTQVYPVLPIFVAVRNNTNNFYIHTETYGVKDFSETYFRTINYSNYNMCDLVFVNKEWNTEKIASNISNVHVDNDLSTISYIKNNALYIINDINDNTPVVVADDVIDFELHSNGQALYYLDSSDTLWYKNTNKDAERIADDVYSIDITHDDYILFLTDYGASSGVLYASKNGNTKKQLHDDVYYLLVGKNVTYYAADYNYETHTYDLYATDSKTSFELIIESVS